MKNLCLPILILILFMTSCSKKKKTLKNIGNNRHDKTRLEIRAKMLRARLLNVDAGKRGFGRPSRSVDKL